MRSTTALYLRSIVFGINDSLVSTVGFLAGVSVAGVPRETIILTGVIYALVESFSMGMGEFLSEEAGEEYVKQGDVSERSPAIAGALMFVSCVLASLIPLAPYFLFESARALGASVVLSVGALFIAGLVSARISHLPVLKRGIRMALLGGATIVLGVTIGLFMPV